MPAQERSGKLFILIGPGGVGKNALMEQVLPDVENLRQLPTATTRAPREGEQHGVQHLFVSIEEFEQMIHRGELLEHQEVHPGKFYGVPRQPLEGAIEDGSRLIADVDFKGANVIRETYPEHAIAIFIAPPSMDTLEARLRDRDTSEGDIRERLERANAEMLYAPVSDYVIINDSFEATTHDLKQILHLAEDKPGSPNPKSLRYDVQFAAHVQVVRPDSVLVSGSGTPLSFEVTPGASVSQATLQGVASLLGIEPQANQLELGFSAAHAAVEINHEADTAVYTINYYFTYNLPLDVAPPVGWRWASLDEVTLMQEG